MKKIKSLSLTYLCSALVALTMSFVFTSCDEDKYEAVNCTISPKLENNQVSFPKEGGKKVLTLDVTRDWSLTKNAAWIGVNPQKGVKGKATITIKVAENTGDARKGSIKLSYGGKETTIHVLQAGKNGELPEGPVSGKMSLADFYKKYNTDKNSYDADPIEEDITLEATVITDVDGGNNNVSFVVGVQQGDTGFLLAIPKGTPTPKLGDVLEINVKGAKFSHYAKKNEDGTIAYTAEDIQLSYAKVKVIGNKPIAPKVLTLEQIYTGQYKDILVTVENVQFVKPNVKMNASAPEKNWYHKLSDCKTKAPEGNADLSLKVLKKANFAAEMTTDKNGSVTGVLKTNKNKEGNLTYWNILIRNMSDLQMTADRKEDPNNPADNGGDNNGTGGDNNGNNGDNNGNNGGDNNGNNGGTVDEAGVIFLETFGTPVKGKYWPSVDKYDGWVVKTNTYSDPLMTGSYSNASARSTSKLPAHIWFAANKTSALKIEGFKTGAKLQLSMKLCTNQKTLNASAFKINTDKGYVALPDTELGKNKFNEYTVDLPDNVSWIQFEAKGLADGIRLTDVKLVKKS